MNQPILPLVPEGATVISDIVSVYRSGDTWTYFHGMFPIFSHKSDHLQSFRCTIAQLIDSGACRQCDVINAFGISKNRAVRAVRQLRERGIESFYLPRKSRRGGTILTPECLSKAQSLLNEGATRSQISDKLNVKSDTLRKAINDGRLVEPDKVKGTTKSQRSVEDAAAAESIGTACTREDERMMAAIGLLSGATVTFETALDVSYGGVLCALPALLANGLLNGVEKSLGALNGYYTQFNILLLLGFMALSRIKTVEQLGSESAGEMGLLLGLDRSPGVRCLREKLGMLAGEANAEVWAAQLSRQWMEQNPDMCGYLYVDGHIGVYHGSLTKIPRRFVSRERLCLRGISNYWVNDALGCPFFVVEKQIDAGLQEALTNDIIPRLLQDIPDQPSEEDLETNPWKCRFAVIFDREGYSPKLFKKLWKDHRIACMTYHKYPKDPWPEEWFVEHKVTLIHGEVTTMKLAEMGTRIGTGKNALWVREVRKLTDSGHQTSIVGTVFEPQMTQLAPQMFARWCQENYLRYMMQHFAIDLIPERGVESFHGTEKVVNPQWRDLQRCCNSLTNKLRYRRAKFTELSLHPATNDDLKRHEKWEKAKAELLEEIEQLENELNSAKAKRKKAPKHITWDELPEDQQFDRLPSSKKRLTDTIKMIAYRAETSMATLMQDSTTSIAEAKALLLALFCNEADILPDLEAKTLTVRVHGAATPVANRTILKLLEHLNQTETQYPGTDLTLVYECAIPANSSSPKEWNGDTANSEG